MSRLPAVAVMLALCLTLTSADPVTIPTRTNPESKPESAQVRALVAQLVSDARQVIKQANNGISLADLRQNMTDLQTDASNLLHMFSSEASESETQSVIRMVTGEIGSHEILTLLLADDYLSVLSGRLGLAMAFLERTVQLMEDEMSRSHNVAPHLGAAIFDAKVTIDIIDDADTTLTTMIMLANDDNNNNGNDNSGKRRVRRQLNFTFKPPSFLARPFFTPPSINFTPKPWSILSPTQYPPLNGPINLHLTPPKQPWYKTRIPVSHGFSLGISPLLKWQSKNRKFSVEAGPTLSGNPFVKFGFKLDGRKKR